VLHPIEGGVAAHPFERGVAALPFERGVAARPFAGGVAAYPFEGGEVPRPFGSMALHPFDTGSDTARLRDLAQPVGGPPPSLGHALLPPRYSHAADPAGVTARGTSASAVALVGSGTRCRYVHKPWM
jgi:hypothetical protein